MDGLYAVLDHTAKKVRLCPFPYSLAVGRREARRLRRLDPPHDVILPANPLASIAEDERSAAYHFLLRAVLAMMAEQNPQAVRYLTAFSALARVRFAYIEAVPESAGFALNLTVVADTNYKRVHQLFSNPLGDQ